MHDTYPRHWSGVNEQVLRSYAINVWRGRKRTNECAAF